MSDQPGALANVPAETTEPASGAAAGSFLSEIRSGGAGADGAGASEGVAAEPSRFKVSGPTALVLVVAAVGLGALLGMRKLTTPGSAMATVNIDYTPGQKTPAEAHKRLVEVLDRSSTPVQVPTDQIKKNPFQLSTAPASSTPIAKGGEDDAAARIRMEAAALASHQRKIADTLATLKVNGIILGSVPAARVNGEMVRVGDTLGDGLFVIAAMGPRSITVSADGHEYELTMDEATSNSKSPRKR